MKFKGWFSLFALILLSPFLLRAQSEAGDKRAVFFCDFETAELSGLGRSKGNGRAVIEGIPGASRSLLVHNPGAGNHLVSIPLPVGQLRGMRAVLSGKVKAENVSKPREPWNGVKLMLYTLSPRGPDYQGMMDLYGSFEQKELGLPVIIPADATEASIVLGLQDSSGKVWFDDVTLRLSGGPRKRPGTPAPLPPPEELDRRTDLSRLRGVMYGPKGKKEDLEKLAEWKANLIRWQFYWHDGTNPEKRLNLKLYDQWLDETMAGLDALLPLCQKLGLRVVIDLHTPPGAGQSGNWAMFSDPAYQKRFIEVWDKLANHYKDQPAVWGYDLVNEPVEGKVADGLMDWPALAGHVAKRVRAIDPHKAIIVEPGPSGGWGNLPFFEPIQVPGIVYSVHLYDPIQFTHQGILGGMPLGQSYPGTVQGVKWDKEKLKEILSPVRDYQKDYGVPVYIGEFSAPRWAPDGSAARYLRDCVEIFEEYGWDWSYHAFREWHGWNVELGDDQNDFNPPATPSDRELVLRKGLSLNGK